MFARFEDDNIINAGQRKIKGNFSANKKWPTTSGVSTNQKIFTRGVCGNVQKRSQLFQATSSPGEKKIQEKEVHNVQGVNNL